MDVSVRKSMHLAVPMLLGVSVVMGGCKSSAPADPFVKVVPASQSGMQRVARARMMYGALLTGSAPSSSPAGDNPWAGLLGELDAAVATDPGVALFHSKRGDVLLEAGRADEAIAAYRRSVELLGEWVPGWLGMAQADIRTGNCSRAAQSLASAEAALATLRRAREDEMRRRSAGISGDPQGIARENFANRYFQVRLWLGEHLSWEVDEPRMSDPELPQVLLSMREEDMFRRMAAWATYLRALCEHGASDAGAFESVLVLDPEFAPARIDKAARLRKQGSPREAWALLEPLAERSSAALMQSPVVLVEAAASLADLAAQSGGRTNDFASRQAADGARKLLGRAEARLGGVTPQTQRIRTALEQRKPVGAW